MVTQARSEPALIDLLHPLPRLNGPTMRATTSQLIQPAYRSGESHLSRVNSVSNYPDVSATPSVSTAIWLRQAPQTFHSVLLAAECPGRALIPVVLII